MISDALQMAADYKQMEADAKQALVSSGAGLPADAVADVMERLAIRRGWVCSILIAARSKASIEERRELDAVLLSVNSALRF